MKENALLIDLDERGLLAQMTGDGALAGHLNESPRKLYCGFDPTAESLHIGSLVPLLTLRRFQLAGHAPIALVGGATGLIGDPSFKAQERRLNTPDVVADWVGRLKSQVSRFIDFDEGANSAEVVDNLDWVGKLDVLTFLRDVGKHFSINNMVQKESVKQRLDREGDGISFTEFTYMILQSYDFAELYRTRQCTLQIGGSDQWGNITGGTDLVRRLHGGRAFGLTTPLVTKADGTKFGKTESGTIWLEPSKTSPYAFYQFWLNTNDADVYTFLKYFTFLDCGRIAEIELSDKASSGRPEAQSILANSVTELVHGAEGVTAAKRISDAMFNQTLNALSEADLQQLRLDGLPASFLDPEDKQKPLTTLLVDCGLVKAGREVKDALGRKAVAVNGEVLGLDDNMKLNDVFEKGRSLYGRFFLVKLGKKKNHLFELR